jgi:hypothetical protein
MFFLVVFDSLTVRLKFSLTCKLWFSFSVGFFKYNQTMMYDILTYLMPKNASQKMQGEKTKFEEAKMVISLVVFTHIIISLRRRQSQTRRLRNGQNLLECKGFLKLCKQAKIEARILHHYWVWFFTKSKEPDYVPVAFCTVQCGFFHETGFRVNGLDIILFVFL